MYQNAQQSDTAFDCLAPFAHLRVPTVTVKILLYYCQHSVDLTCKIIWEVIIDTINDVEVEIKE